jgi:hypothetical protein
VHAGRVWVCACVRLCVCKTVCVCECVRVCVLTLVSECCGCVCACMFHSRTCM